MPSTQLSSPRNVMTCNERSLYPCLFRAWQACTCAVDINKNLNAQHKIPRLTFYFQLRFVTEQSVSFLFILNSHMRGIGPTILALDWLRRGRVEVFVSLCSYSTGRCVRCLKRLGIETFVENNGERIIGLWNRGWGIDIWRIGLSEHTKERDDWLLRYLFS